MNAKATEESEWVSERESKSSLLCMQSAHHRFLARYEVLFIKEKRLIASKSSESENLFLSHLELL